MSVGQEVLDHIHELHQIGSPINRQALRREMPDVPEGNFTKMLSILYRIGIAERAHRRANYIIVIPGPWNYPDVMEAYEMILSDKRRRPGAAHASFSRSSRRTGSRQVELPLERTIN